MLVKDNTSKLLTSDDGDLSSQARSEPSSMEAECHERRAAGGGEMPQPTSSYLLVRGEKGGLLDVLVSLVSRDRTRGVFLEASSDGVLAAADHRWVILVSVIVRKIISLFRKPMDLVGVVVVFLLNLLSLNGELPGLILNLLAGRVVIPQKGSDTFISIIGHLDGRLDLCRTDIMDASNMEMDSLGTSIPLESNALMDLCIMASKLAYENANVIRNVVINHWKMHFVEFYNCWNDYEKERSTQVFMLCDKPIDANIVLISFRGTEPFDADDWITDWDYSWYEIPELGRVHMGFLEALGLGNRDELSMVHLQQDHELLATKNKDTAYHTVRNRLQRLLGEHKHAQFVVTGHSLGGALAILFPAVLLYHKQEELMKRLLGIYTFGQPRIGDRQLERFMNAHVCHPVNKYFRVVYCNDIVPRLPYDNKTLPYKHFGLCLYFNSFYKEKDVEEVPNRNYHQKIYINAVWELIRSFIMGYTYGAEYQEGWFSTLLRIWGLILPGISAHSPREYVNCVRLGRKVVQMTSL